MFLSPPDRFHPSSKLKHLEQEVTDKTSELIQMERDQKMAEDTFKTSLAEAKSKVETLKQQMDEEQQAQIAQISSLTLDCTNLKEKLSITTATLTEKDEELFEKCTQVSELTKDLETKEAELEKVCSDQKLSLAALTSEIDELKGQEVQRQTERQQENEDKLNLVNQLSDLNNQLNSKETEIQVFRDQVKKEQLEFGEERLRLQGELEQKTEQFKAEVGFQDF